MLTRLFVTDKTGLPLTTLAREIGLAASRVHEEARRLEAAGLVRSERVGNSRLLRANEDSPLYPALSELLLKAFGPVRVLESALSGISGIDEAFVFGSWASRYLGEEGEAPNDIDVLIIGAPDVRIVRSACRDAARELGRDVAPTLVSREEWRDAASGFLQTVKARPMIRLALEGG
ncbi:MAG: winged helix-turn-helix domain-containing protein [Gaiellaceae bacterium]